MKRCPAFIWDMDGVIVDSGPLHFHSWKEILRPYGVELSWEAFQRTFGMRNPDIIKSTLRRGVSKKLVDEISEKKEKRFRELIRKGIDAFPGVLSLILRIKSKGLQQALATSAPRENVDAILQALGLQDKFDAMVTGEHVRHGKPHPEVFLKAAQALHLSPQRCIVIEDAKAGVEAAKSAKMKVIAVTNTLPREELLGADVVLDTLDGRTVEDLLTMLGE